MDQQVHDQRPFKRYALAFFLILAIVLLVVMGINRLIDPYGLWPTPRIENINLIKTTRRDLDYLFKSRDLVYQQPKTLFIGSSRTAFSLSPDAPAIVQNNHAPAYNAALVGGNIAVTRLYLEHAIYNNPNLKTVVLGLDYFSFNKSLTVPQTIRQDRLLRSSFSLRDLFDNLVSLHVLQDSWITLSDNRHSQAQPPFTAQGQLTSWQMQENVRRQGMRKRFAKSLDRYINGTTRFGQYEFSPKYWNELIRIKTLAAEHDIKLIVFVSPVHMSLFEAMHYRGLWDDYQLWLKNLATEFEFWDYSLPNEYNTEQLNDFAQHYWDVSHYREDVGNAVLNDLFHSSPASLLGRKVTSENIDRYLQQLNTEFLKWRLENFATVRFVKDTAH